MKTNCKLLIIFSILLLFVLISSCGGGGSSSGVITCSQLASLGYTAPSEPEPDDANSHMEITNNDNTLDQFFDCQDQILFDQPGASQSGVMIQGKKKGRWKDGFKLRLWAESSPPKIVGKAAAKPGSVLLNDLTSGGTYTGTQQSPPYVKYRVEIDGTSPDTFKWSDDDGATWQATGVAITAGSPQTLSNGVTVTFGADTGHALADYWNIHTGILQATSVSMKGGDAVVSYSMVGSPYLGAIRVYRKYHGFPFLRSQALFRDTDINAVSVSGGKIYSVGASEPGVFPAPAVLELLKMIKSRLTLTGNSRLGLPSFAGTSVIHDSGNKKIYATSGNTGGLTIIDDTTFTIDNTDSLDDARWVEFERNTDTHRRGIGHSRS